MGKDTAVKYMIRLVHRGRIHEMWFNEHDTAIIAFEALFDTGYRPELWQGLTKLR